MFEWLFSTEDFTPRAHCGNWSLGVQLLHIVSDATIAVAYLFLLPVVLLFYWHFVQQGYRYRTLTLGFAAFIFWCGMTHVSELLVWFWPAYRWFGVVKTICAAASMATAIPFVVSFPRIRRALSVNHLSGVLDEIKGRLDAAK